MSNVIGISGVYENINEIVQIHMNSHQFAKMKMVMIAMSLRCLPLRSSKPISFKMTIELYDLATIHQKLLQLP